MKPLDMYNYKVILVGYTNEDDSKPTYCQEHWHMHKEAALAMYRMCISYVRMLKCDKEDVKYASVRVIRMADDKVLRWYEYTGQRCINHPVVPFERW